MTLGFVDIARAKAGIQARLADADLLWQLGRRESAFLLALTALGARSRLALPEVKGDRDAFVTYLTAQHGWRIEIEYRGKQWPIDNLIYTWLRCQLVHEGALPIDLVIDDTLSLDGGLSVRAGGAPEYVLSLSPAWFDFISSAADPG